MAAATMPGYTSPIMANSHLANLAADVRLAYTLSWAFTELVRVSVTGGDRDICSMEHAMGKA